MRTFAIAGLVLSLAALPAWADDPPRSQPRVGLELENQTVVSVAPQSPAAQANFAPGDVIIEVDHQPVSDALAMMRLLQVNSGSGHIVRVRRGDAEVELHLGAPADFVWNLAPSASGPLKYLVTLKTGAIAQGELVEYVPDDHVTLHLATGEVHRYAWIDVADAKPSQAVSVASTPIVVAPVVNDSPRPRAGAWVADFRIPTTFTKTDTGVAIGTFGLEMGIGKRITKRWYLGGTAEWSHAWNLSTDDMPNVARLGAEARYIFNKGQAEVSENGDDGPYYPVGRFDWLGLRAGVETLDFPSPKGGFTELAIGTDAWFSSVQFGMSLAVGLSIEPQGAYGSTGTQLLVSENLPLAPQQGPSLNPYANLAFHFGFGS